MRNKKEKLRHVKLEKDGSNYSSRIYEVDTPEEMNLEPIKEAVIIALGVLIIIFVWRIM